MVRPVYQRIGRPSNYAPDPKSGVHFMAAVGYNFRLLQAWLAVLLRLLLVILDGTSLATPIPGVSAP